MIKHFIILLTLLLLLFAGCEPLSLQDPSPERDQVPDVLALITPDSAQTGQDFSVKLSYPAVCGGTYTGTLVHYDTLGRVFLQPVLHIVPQSGCPDVQELKTVTVTVNFTTQGPHEIVAVGNLGTFRKTIEVANSLDIDTTYTLRFRFANRWGDPLYLHQSRLTFTAATPVEEFDVVTDENGLWDTTFALSSTTLPYKIASFRFTALRGLTEEGVIIIP